MSAVSDIPVHIHVRAQVMQGVLEEKPAVWK
jgi:hypothetical protein